MFHYHYVFKQYEIYSSLRFIDRNGQMQKMWKMIRYVQG